MQIHIDRSHANRHSSGKISATIYFLTSTSGTPLASLTTRRDDIGDVQISGVLHGLGQIDRIAQYGGALVRFGKSDGAVHIQPSADNDLVLGTAEELDRDTGLDAGLLARDGCGGNIEIMKAVRKK